ncbi:hypothetical protein CEXT_127461 [Caerostris extrusa]|uniref:Uncharacterized protein n=1 Tax=Caerostris extrusa TaxID=172846 RepID=A0AAV4Y3B5_CAEEX|nr:hypothetical protein CEXT_127461 [Caerostris extrusa]
MIPNRAQIPPRPILPIKEEIAIKKLPIPMQEFKHQSTADHLIPHADPVALGHLPSDKIEKLRNTAHQNHELGKPNVTIHETPDSFKSDLNKDSRKSNLPPSKFFDSTATVDQSDNLKDTDEKQQFSSNEDDNNNSEKVDVTIVADYPDYDVPFGARLKNTPNNGSTKPKLTSQILNRPFPRKPQLTSTSYLERFTVTPILSTAPEPDIKHSEDNEKQEFFDTTVLPFLESFTTKEILPAKETDLQNESMNNPQKFEPLFLDDATLEKHKGRKIFYLIVLEKILITQLFHQKYPIT